MILPIFYMPTIKERRWGGGGGGAEYNSFGTAGNYVCELKQEDTVILSQLSIMPVNYVLFTNIYM